MKLWEQKLETASAKLKGEIEALKKVQETQGKLLERMDGKLDTLVRNGNKGRGRI
jgi:hypothetical protein